LSLPFGREAFLNLALNFCLSLLFGLLFWAGNESGRRGYHR
jgi:hypothetical protein